MCIRDRRPPGLRAGRADPRGPIPGHGGPLADLRTLYAGPAGGGPILFVLPDESALLGRRRTQRPWLPSGPFHSIVADMEFLGSRPIGLILVLTSAAGSSAMA